jgi:hypothetical protein
MLAMRSVAEELGQLQPRTAVTVAVTHRLIGLDVAEVYPDFGEVVDAEIVPEPVAELPPPVREPDEPAMQVDAPGDDVPEVAAM